MRLQSGSDKHTEQNIAHCPTAPLWALISTISGFVLQSARGRPMEDLFSRTETLIGAAALQKLSEARVAVFGLGGVGSYAAEALVRSGVGALDLVDNDRIHSSNMNRQLFALRSTEGAYKVDAAEARFSDINPDCRITTHRLFFSPETAGAIDFSQFDYIIDAIDSVGSKIALVQAAHTFRAPIISCMGTGNKLNPTAFTVGDVFETSVCPLARVMRRELRKRAIAHLKVVYSTEKPAVHHNAAAENLCVPADAPDAAGDTAHVSIRRSTPASIAFVPPVAGFILAGEAIKDLIAGCLAEGYADEKNAGSSE